MNRDSDAAGRERRYAYLILTVSVFFLALNHIISRGVHEHVPPLGLSFWRWFVAVILLLPLVMVDLRSTLTVYREHWRAFLLLGGFIVGATSLMMVALNHTTATNTALINATQPTFTVLFSWLFYGVRLKYVQIAGIVAAFLGVLVMVCQGRWQILATFDFNVGDLIALASMLGFAAYSVRFVRLEHGLSPGRALFPIMLGGCTLLLPFYVGESLLARPLPINPTSVSAILSIALLVSLCAMLMWNAGMRMVGANRASIFINLVPVFGALLAVTLLGEQFELFHLLGMILIGIGVRLVVGPPVTGSSSNASAPT